MGSHPDSLAPEGISCVRLSSPQRLKPIHLDCKMYGLKAVPFNRTQPLKTFPPKTLRYLVKRKVCSLRTTLIPPQLENATVTERDKFALANPELSRGGVDPFARTLKLCINPQRRFVDHAMSLLIRPFRAPFLIHKHGTEAQGLEDLAHCWTVLNQRLGFHPVLVRTLFREAAGDALVGDHPFASVLANAQDLARVAQLAIGCVMERITLQGALGDARKAKRRQLLLQRLAVRDPNLYFCFHGLHRPESIPRRHPMGK